MHPILFRLGPLTIHTYGVMLALGALAGLLLLRRLARAAGQDPERLQGLALWVLLAGMAGARIGFMVLEPGGLSRPWEILAIWRGGLVFYGGLAAALPVAWWQGRRLGMPLPALADLLAPALALAQAFGRLGCFFSGDSFGRPWDGPWAVTFNDPHTLAPRGVPLHPTQLYISAALFIIAFALWRLFPRRRRPGQVALAYGLLHGTARLLIEPLRGDWRGQVLWAGLTPTGLFALALVLACLAGLVWMARRPRVPLAGSGAKG